MILFSELIFVFQISFKIINVLYFQSVLMWIQRNRELLGMDDMKIFVNKEQTLD